jgi:hypothetical protein
VPGPGVYDNAGTFPSGPSTIPRVRFNIGSLGCAALTGRVVIHDVAYVGDEAVARLLLSFEQRCVGSSGGLRGEFALNR